MTRFRFPLEKVLSVRHMESLQAQQRLAAAQLSLHVCADRLSEARESRARFGKELERRRSSGMAAWEWALSSQQYDRLSRAERQAERDMEAADEYLRACATELQEAAQREASLERLRDHQLEGFQLTLQASEQAVMDEVAGAQYRRHHLTR